MLVGGGICIWSSFFASYRKNTTGKHSDKYSGKREMVGTQFCFEKINHQRSWERSRRSVGG